MNYVNAPLIARERGIEVREERSQSARDFTNLLRVEIAVGDEVTRIAGTLIVGATASGSRAPGFELDPSSRRCSALRYDDIPGVISASAHGSATRASTSRT